MISKKNILFIDNSRPIKNGSIGGSINSMIQLIIKLDNSKYNIYLLLYYRIPLLENKFKKLGVNTFYKYDSLTIKRNTAKKKISKILPFYHDLFIIKNFSQVEYLSSIIKNNKIDIIHANNRINANILCLLAAKKCGVPYIQHQRMFEKNMSLTAKIFKNYPKYYISISESIRKNVFEIINVSERKNKLIHNWINTETLNNNDRFFDGKIFKILWIGRILPWKGLDILIEIARELKFNDFGDFEIDIYGDYAEEDYKHMLINMIKNYDLIDIINFKGFKLFKDINREEYSVFIHTSKTPEPFGRTIIENMLAEIPVCATSMGGVIDIINHKENGILYNHNNYKEIIPLLTELKLNSEFKNKLIYNGKKTIIEKFSGKSQIKIIEKIYDNL